MIVKIQNLSKDVNNSSPGYYIDYKGFRLKPGQAKSLRLNKVPTWVWELAIPSTEKSGMDPSKFLLVVPIRPQDEPFTEEDILSYRKHFGVKAEIAIEDGDTTVIEPNEDGGSTIIEPAIEPLPEMKPGTNAEKFLEEAEPNGDMLIHEDFQDDEESSDNKIEDVPDLPDKIENDSEVREILLSETKNSDGNYQCPFCEKIYKVDKFFKMHLLKIHGKILKIDEES